MVGRWTQEELDDIKAKARATATELANAFGGEGGNAAQPVEPEVIEVPEPATARLQGHHVDPSPFLAPSARTRINAAAQGRVIE